MGCLLARFVTLKAASLLLSIHVSLDEIAIKGMVSKSHVILYHIEVKKTHKITNEIITIKYHVNTRLFRSFKNGTQLGPLQLGREPR